MTVHRVVKSALEAAKHNALMATTAGATQAGAERDNRNAMADLVWQLRWMAHSDFDEIERELRCSTAPAADRKSGTLEAQTEGQPDTNACRASRAGASECGRAGGTCPLQTSGND